MKTCPACHRNYEDNSLRFCLDDGTALLAETASGMTSEATLVLPGHVTEQPEAERPTSPSPPAQPTMTSLGFKPVAPYPAGAQPAPASGGNRAYVLLVVVALIIGGSVIAAALIMSRSKSESNANGGSTSASSETPYVNLPSESPTPTYSSTPYRSPMSTPTPIYSPRSTPTPTHSPRSEFTTLDNTSLNGSRITYYPRSSFGSCQADCAANARCKGLAWIRPGAYNPGDAAMCYLLSEVTGRVSHPCCIAAVRN